MQKLFLGIYGSVILAISSVLLLSYYSFSSLNQYRYKQHLVEQLSGTLYLLTQGIERQTEPADRKRWLELVSSLMNVELLLQPNSSSGDTWIVEKKDSQQHGNHYQVTLPINAQQSLSVSVEGISEQVITGTAFLLLNELGRFPANQRQARFEQLAKQFNYQLGRVDGEVQGLDSEQLERLSRGEMVVVWQTEFDRGMSINVYAPWGNSTDLLKLGEIELFEPYPTWLLLLGMAIVLFVLAVWIMLVIRGLANRLKFLQRKVDAIEPELLEAEQAPEQQDVINQLTWKIDQMVKRIQRLISQKSYMIRAVSHDLRTPLSKAQFRLEALSTELGEGHPLVTQTKQDLGQLNLLIGELLSYEKLSQHQKISVEMIDLVPFIGRIVDDIHLVYPTKRFHFTSQQQVCNAEVNQLLFVRMLENLLNNAGHFAKTQIKINLKTTMDKVVLDIIDDGNGIDESIRSHIFEPFYQQEQSRSNKPAGYGLGLAIVKQIAIQHGADIRLVDSQKGAFFSIEMPCADKGTK